MVKNIGSWALKEEEIELDLRLSVGGSYSRQNGAGLKSDSSIDSVSGAKNLDSLRSSISSSFDAAEENQMTKKEIQALRRQEAKKKREEKQLKRAFSKANFNGGQIKGENQNGCKNDSVLQANNSQNDGRECKKMKKEENESDQINDMNNKIRACYATPGNPSYVQYATTPDNGFMNPWANVMSCWFAGGAAATTEEKHMVQVLPVVGHGYMPLDLEHASGNGYDSEEICTGDRGNTKSGSNGSNNGTSSTCSDHRSSCNEGGGSNSSYTRSHSSPAPQQPQIQPNVSKRNDSDLTAISNLSECASVNTTTTTTTTTNATSNSTRTESKPKSGHKNNPPKPVSLEQTTSPPLPYMPCVSTTGNGPNGKTVNGFLYRYTKTEVSIICVCHGSSFSPAEFVQHAGGTDVLHPLKHITVIPSAF